MCVATATTTKTTREKKLGFCSLKSDVYCFAKPTYRSTGIHNMLDAADCCCWLLMMMNIIFVYGKYMYI
jgi:hypothetical protein